MRVKFRLYWNISKDINVMVNERSPRKSATIKPEISPRDWILSRTRIVEKAVILTIINSYIERLEHFDYQIQIYLSMFEFRLTCLWEVVRQGVKILKSRQTGSEVNWYRRPLLHGVQYLRFVFIFAFRYFSKWFSFHVLNSPPIVRGAAFPLL